jgi:two-component system sensor histidine kinase KdpD
VEGDKFLIEVADRGPGLPLEQTERIFDSFHRAPGAKPGGAGLGLTIVKGFVEAQGGSVTARNRQGGGAVFRVCLSAAEKPEFPLDTL